MGNTAYIALSRQMSLIRQLDIVANNIANANTAGFKSEHAMFAEYLPEGGGADDQPSFVEDVAIKRDTSPGQFVPTGNSLDVAIHGDGYLVLRTPAGDRYTRNGHFRVNEAGVLIGASGYPVLDDRDREIVIGREVATVGIARDGTVSTDTRNVARIRVVSFENEQALRKTMSGLYTTDADPLPAQGSVLLQGMIEESNVQPILEMTRMIQIQRDFQGAHGMVDGEHERVLRAIREIPKTQAN